MGNRGIWPATACHVYETMLVHHPGENVTLSCACLQKSISHKYDTMLLHVFRPQTFPMKTIRKKQHRCTFCPTVWQPLRALWNQNLFWKVKYCDWNSKDKSSFRVVELIDFGSDVSIRKADQYHIWFMMTKQIKSWVDQIQGYICSQLFNNCKYYQTTENFKKKICWVRLV